MDTVFKLEDLVLDEVSLVDKAANEGARIVFAKRETSGIDSDEFIYKRASVKGDPPAGENMDQIEKVEVKAAIAKAIGGGSSRNEIDSLITKAVGKKATVEEQAAAESEFLKTPIGEKLYNAREAAPLQAPVVKLSKLEVELQKQRTLHEHARAHQKASGNRLKYGDAWNAALAQHPELEPKPIGEDTAAAA